MWQWLGYNVEKAILADTTNLETFSDISDLTPVSWSDAGGIQIVNDEYFDVISKVTAESKFYNNSYGSGTAGTILFELDRSADEAYIHGVVNVVLDQNGGTNLGAQSLLKVDFVKNTQGVDSCVIGLSQDYRLGGANSKFYHVYKSSENKDYLIITWGVGDPLNVKVQWNSLTCKNVTMLGTPLTQTWLNVSGTSAMDMDGYIISNNKIESALSADYATSAGYATTATNATYASQCNSANYAITANYALGSLSANNANMVDNYHVVVGTTGTATNTIYFM